MIIMMCVPRSTLSFRFFSLSKVSDFMPHEEDAYTSAFLCGFCFSPHLHEGRKVFRFRSCCIFALGLAYRRSSMNTG